ncbi:hypothetical protein PV779_29915 [Streptomyces sp. ID01-9D]|nr:hypothetical protein [Streptomyces sp. ID01-9D]
MDRQVAQQQHRVGAGFADEAAQRLAQPDRKTGREFARRVDPDTVVDLSRTDIGQLGGDPFEFAFLILGEHNAGLAVQHVSDVDGHVSPRLREVGGALESALPEIDPAPVQNDGLRRAKTWPCSNWQKRRPTTAVRGPRPVRAGPSARP